ncbi:hypothetical protein FMO003_25840 [Moritella sp. F3]|nr:hypothetical protein FMO001_19110 [Moritella sp. F1]GIC82303.1 hypothetical protein FMO003_25840 [Moritella sp. F3]
MRLYKQYSYKQSNQLHGNKMNNITGTLKVGFGEYIKKCFCGNPFVAGVCRGGDIQTKCEPCRLMAPAKKNG